MTGDRVRILAREALYDGFSRLTRLVYQFRQLDGDWSPEIEREVLERHAAAAVLPYDPQRDAVVLIEQFRPGAHLAGHDGWQLEPLGGIRDPGEAPQETARREALEEAGCNVTDLQPVCGFLISPGSVAEHVSVYCGRTDADKVGVTGGRAEEGEETRVQIVPFADAEASLAAGRFEFALTLIALHWLVIHRPRLRAMWT